MQRASIYSDTSYTIQHNGASSATTIFALANTMIGTVVLLIPINFGLAGIITSMIIMVIIGYFSYDTCYWIVSNTKNKENELSQVILRILGKKWFKIFSIGSSLQLFSVGVVYFLLVNSTVWKISEFIFHKFGYNDLPLTNSIEFGQYSIQWQAIILLPIFFPLFFMKDAKFVVKFAGYGTVAIYSYLMFIFYIFYDNLSQGNISKYSDQIQYFSFSGTEISKIIGNFALAFMIHNVCTKILSANHDQKKNNRDIQLAFALVCFFYGSIGCMGYLGLLGRKSLIENPVIIYDYFGVEDTFSIVIESLFLINLITVYPVFPFISKSQLFSVFYDLDKNNWDNVPNISIWIFNIIFAITCLIVQLTLVNVNYVIGISGAVVGFLVGSFHASQLVQDMGINTFNIIFYLFVFIILFILASMLQNRFNSNENQSSTVLFYQKFILQIVMTFLFIPTLQILLTPFQCEFFSDVGADGIVYHKQITQENLYIDCYQVNNMINMCIGALFFLIFLGIVLTLETIMFESNIYKNEETPLVKSSGILNVQYNLVAALFCILHTIFGGTKTKMMQSVAVLLIQLLFSFFLAYKFTFRNSYHDIIMKSTWKGNVSALFWTNFCLMIAFLFEGFYIKGSLIACFIAYPLLYFIVFTSTKRDWKILLINPQNFKTDQQIIEQVDQLRHLLVQTIKNRNNNLFVIDGFLEIHTLTCNKEDCICLTKRKDQRKVGISMDLTSTVAKENHQNKILQLDWIIKEILFYGVKQFPESLNLRMTYVFYLVTQNKKQNALAQITQSERFSLNFSQKFIVERNKKIIQSEISNQRNSNSGNQDILAEIAFQEQIQVLIEIIKSISLLYIDFWELFKEQIPDLVKIQNSSMILNDQVGHTKDEWDKLLVIGGNMQRVTHIYGKYMLEVRNNKEEGQKLIENGIEMQFEKQKQEEQMIITENEDIQNEPQPTVIITTESDKFTQIVAVNQASIGYFKHNKGSILNKKVEYLMPPTYKNSHDSFVENLVLDNNWQKVKIKEKFVYAQDKYHYLLPTYIQVHPFQTLTQTLQFIGVFKTEVFFKKLGLIMTDKTGFIQNLSYGCIQVLQISREFITDSEGNLIKKHINEILPIWDTRKQYITKLGKMIDGMDNFISQQKQIGPSNSQICQTNLCIQELHFNSQPGKVQGYLFKFEQINDSDNSEMNRLKETEKQKVISNLFNQNQSPQSEKQEDIEKQQSTEEENYNSQQKQLEQEYKEEEIPDAFYRFSFENQNEGLVMNWSCIGSYYGTQELNNYKILNFQENDQTKEQTRIQIESAKYAEDQYIKATQVKYGEGIKTIRLLKNKFEVVDMYSDSDEEEDQSLSLGSKQTAQSLQSTKSSDVYSEFSNIQKSQKAIEIVTTDNFQIESIKKLKIVVIGLFVIITALAVIDIIYAQVTFQENIDRINTVIISNKRVSDLQSTLGFVRDLKLLSQGLYDEIFTEEEKIQQEKQWKEQITKDIILIRDIQREISLSPIEPSEEQFELITQQIIPMYFNEDINEEEKQKVIQEVDNPTQLQLTKTHGMYNLNDAVRQILAYIHKTTTVSINDLKSNDSFTYFVETNMFNEFFYKILRSSQIYAEDFIKSNDNKIIIFTLIVCSPTIILILSFLIQTKLMTIVQKSSEDILVLLLDIDEDIVKYMQNRANTFYYNLLQDKDEEVESFEKFTKDDKQEINIGLGQKKRKKYIYKHKIHFFFKISLILLNLFIQSYFLMNYIINTELVSDFSGINTELNSTSIAEPFFFFADNLQRAAFIDPDNFKPFEKDASQEIINNLLITYELDQKIHSDHSFNAALDLPLYKTAFEEIMMLDACKVLYKIKAVTSVSQCESFSAGIVKEGMAPAISKYLENIKYLNTVYDFFVKYPESNFLQYAPEGSIIVDMFKDIGDKGKRQKTMSLLVSPVSMENREMQKIYLKYSFDYLKSQYQESIIELNTSKNNLRIILLSFFISILVCIFVFLWIPFSANLNKDLKKVRTIFRLIPLSIILEIQSMKTYIRAYVISYQKRQYNG